MNINLPDTPFWLYNGNAETIFAKLLQSAPPAYRRELLPDSTGKTQIAYDFVDAARPDAPLVVLFHGLEGGSMSHYAVEMMKAVQRRGWHGVVAHFRGCGGIANTAPVFYHSGDTREIGFMLETLAARYPRIYAAGVSLGGNALAKYLGEEGAAAVPRAAAAVSAPVDLTAAGTRFDRGVTRLLYTRYFLRSLVPKAEAFPHFQTASPLEKLQNAGRLRRSVHRAAARFYRPARLLPPRLVQTPAALGAYAAAAAQRRQRPVPPARSPADGGGSVRCRNAAATAVRRARRIRQ